MSWSLSDNFFVNSKLEVFRVDLLSKPLELIQAKDIVYDGPKGDDFRRFLRSKNFRVNRQGKVIVRFQKHDDHGEFVECQYDTYALEMIVPLGPFGFQNVPLPKPQVVKELESLLDSTKGELAKKNDEVKELMMQKIDQDLNIVQLRLKIATITKSMKRVFVDFGLEPPASEDPESLLRVLHDLILQKDFGATFLVAGHEMLASIASVFEKRTGLNIGMGQNSPSTPARFIKSLSTLRSFLVDSHFFIDGSVIIKDLHLMNEEDLPVILRDSATDVVELKKREVGAKSIDNIDRNSIFYGYFNIPTIGMFKGVLTRIHVNLPDEIMVKLKAAGKQNLTAEQRFWFINANGSSIFLKEQEPLKQLEDIQFVPSRCLGDRTDFGEFFCRMNRTFVNEEGKYLKFEFAGGKFSGPRMFGDNTVRYYNKDGGIFFPFKLVQFDANTPRMEILQRQLQLPTSTPTFGSQYPSWIVNEALGNDCVFTFNDFCFMGKITKASDTFRKNALVSVFFEQNQHGRDCYVDALATTSFVLKTEEESSWTYTDKSIVPKFL